MDDGGCRIGQLLAVYLLAHLVEQRLPALHEGMGRLLEVGANRIGHDLGVALNDVGEVHERVGDLALTVDDPRLTGLAQEVL